MGEELRRFLEEAMSYLEKVCSEKHELEFYCRQFMHELVLL